MGTEAIAQTPRRVPAVGDARLRRDVRTSAGSGSAWDAPRSCMPRSSSGSPRRPQRHMGERSGQPDGISVMLVDAADLESTDHRAFSTPRRRVSPAALLRRRHRAHRKASLRQPPEPSKPPEPKEAAVRAIEQEKPAKVPPPEPAGQGERDPPAPRPRPSPRASPRPRPGAAATRRCS